MAEILWESGAGFGAIELTTDTILTMRSTNKEGPLTMNIWVRQGHRWMSIAFTITVIANFIARGFGEPSPWMTYSPLIPLFLLLFSGLYMFVLPYVGKQRAGAPR